MYQAPTPDAAPLRPPGRQLYISILLLTGLFGAGTLFLNLAFIEHLPFATGRAITQLDDTRAAVLFSISFGLLPGLTIGAAEYRFLWRDKRHFLRWIWRSLLGWSLASCVYIFPQQLVPRLKPEIAVWVLSFGYGASGAVTGLLYWQLYRTYHSDSAWWGWMLAKGVGVVAACMLAIVVATILQI